MKINLRTLLFLFFLFPLGYLQAAHVIGGELTYKCLGSGSYQFTLKLYRDCNGGGANFDGAPNSPFPATVSIFIVSNSLSLITSN